MHTLHVRKKRLGKLSNLCKVTQIRSLYLGNPYFWPWLSKDSAFFVSWGSLGCLLRDGHQTSGLHLGGSNSFWPSVNWWKLSQALVPWYLFSLFFSFPFIIFPLYFSSGSLSTQHKHTQIWHYYSVVFISITILFQEILPHVNYLIIHYKNSSKDSSIFNRIVSFYFHQFSHATIILI